MRPVRGLLVAAFAVTALAAATAATARPGPVEDGTLSVRDGRGTIQLAMRGGIIGRYARGKLTVTESLTGDGTVVVRGAERVLVVNERTTVYSGTNIRFRIADRRQFAVRVNARKINFSAIGRGNGWIDGWGNPAHGAFFDGSYSLNGGAYQSLPDLRAPIQLASPPSSG